MIREDQNNLKTALRAAERSVSPAIVMVEDTVAKLEHEFESSPRRTSALCRSLLRLGQLLDSIAQLSSRYRHQDMWSLCRVGCELSINLCYLQVAPEIEFERWSKYDIWTDEQLVSGLATIIPGIDNVLDAEELRFQRDTRQAIEQSGLYKGARPGTWSEKSLENRTRAVDEVLNTDPSIFQTLCRLTMKVGNSFIHVAPRGVGDQTTPVRWQRDATSGEVYTTTQCLAMSVTAVYAAVNFTRARKGFSEHPLAQRMGDDLRLAFDGTMPRRAGHL